MSETLRHIKDQLKSLWMWEQKKNVRAWIIKEVRKATFTMAADRKRSI